jgi:hypothetical protein
MTRPWPQRIPFQGETTTGSTEVHIPIVVVLPERRHDLQAQSDNGALSVFCEFRDRQRGRTEKIHRQAKSRISEASGRSSPRFAGDDARKVRPGYGNLGIELRSPAEHSERAHVRKTKHLDLGTCAFNRQRRFREHIAA